MNMNNKGGEGGELCADSSLVNLYLKYLFLFGHNLAISAMFWQPLILSNEILPSKNLGHGP